MTETYRTETDSIEILQQPLNCNNQNFYQEDCRPFTSEKMWIWWHDDSQGTTHLRRFYPSYRRSRAGTLTSGDFLQRLTDATIGIPIYIDFRRFDGFTGAIRTWHGSTSMTPSG
jgi:hypothetical protein